MSTEERDPYYSKRITVRDVLSPKELAGQGLKSRTIEVVIGNAKAIINTENPQDVCDVKDKSLRDLISEVVNESNESAEEFGWKFVDRVNE